MAGTKNKQGIELQTQYNAVPQAKRAEWLNKLSSAAKSALIAATNQAQQTIPLLSPIIGRFYHERGGQNVQNDWARFDKVVADTNKQFSAIDRISELGIQLGMVGTSFDLKPNVSGGSVDLTPSQRTEFQRIKGEIVIPGIKQYMTTLNTDLPIDKQKQLVQKLKDKLEEKARTQFLQFYKTGQSTQESTPTNSDILNRKPIWAK